MIKKADLALSLRKKAIEISTANNYKLIYEGREFKPITGKSHIADTVMDGDDNKIGMEDGSNDFQIGIYQLMVFYPREKSNLGALDITDTYQLGFIRGTELTENGQMARIMESSVTELKYNPTHLMYAISIKYSVIH